jgi:V8-like Glu-specific endopeptidase
MPKAIPPQLLQLMCDYCPDAGRARVFINEMSIPTDYLDFSGPPKTMWFKLLSETAKHTSLEAVFNQLKHDFPNVDWSHAEPTVFSTASLLPLALLPEEWKGVNSQAALEKIIGRESTLLPVSFLESGIDASRSVAKINIPGVGCATGFLIENNILLTNNHVISNIELAERAEVLFNFQNTRFGRDATVSATSLSPNNVFVTSEEDDWTAIRVEGDANSKWGQLVIANEPAKKDQPVNIIQHPGGQPKQIALYHNLVQYAEPSCVQYLTDTMGGSSGSPVLNSQWEVVAIHRKGGMLREPNSPSLRQYFRNEGTPIDLVRRRLIQEGIIS